jgi:hypothetical protein
VKTSISLAAAQNRELEDLSIFTSLEIVGSNSLLAVEV